MTSFKPLIALLGILPLGACVAPMPAGPQALVLPNSGKSYEQFQQDDMTCRNYAEQSVGGVSPGQAAQESGVNSAIVGTALGAAAGALVGAASHSAGAGAAIGAGAGLLVGSAAGANSAQLSAADLQQRYDMTYVQCMSAKGNNVPAGSVASAEPYAPGPYYPYPPAGYYGPGYYGPPYSVYIGGGWGYHHHW